jgi:hypothetical protein
MLTRHPGHQCSEAASLFDWSQESVLFNINLCREREDGLAKAMQGVRKVLKELQKEKEVYLFTFVTVF